MVAKVSGEQVGSRRTVSAKVPAARVVGSSPARGGSSPKLVATNPTRSRARRRTVERQYVAIDLHLNRSVVVRENEAGEKVGVTRIDNDPEPTVVLEGGVTPCSDWPQRQPDRGPLRGGLAGGEDGGGAGGGGSPVKEKFRSAGHNHQPPHPFGRLDVGHHPSPPPTATPCSSKTSLNNGGPRSGGLVGVVCLVGNLG